MPATPAAVWQMIGDYQALAAWHPAVTDSVIVKGQGNRKGALRSLTLKDGAKIVEELLAYDGRAHSMRYRFVESPLPVKNYVATLAVKAEGKGARIVWKDEFQPVGIDDDKARSIFVGIYRAGFDSIRAKLGEPPLAKNRDRRCDPAHLSPAKRDGRGRRGKTFRSMGTIRRRVSPARAVLLTSNVERP